MKKSTKWKWTAFVMLCFIAMLGTVGMVASAEATENAILEDMINVDYVNETITVKTTKDEVIYYTDSYNKDVSKWDACEVRTIEVEKEDGTTEEVTAAVFDISWVTQNKTVRIYLCGDVNKKVVNVDIAWEEDFDVEFVGTLLTTEITEAEKWQNVYNPDESNNYPGYPNFSEDTGYFIFTVEKNGRDMSYFDLDTIQWRKGDDGVWRDYDELDLKEMNIRGISLEFRVAASNQDSNTDKAGARASSTAKISVAKLNSAPSVTVNTDTMTVAIKNGMEFSFDKETWIMVPAYNKKFGADTKFVTETERKEAIEEIYTNERVSMLLIQEVLKTKVPNFKTNTPMDKNSLQTSYGNVFTFEEKGILLYVREIGTERKAASKITEVYIPYAVEEMAVAEKKDIKISYGESKTNTGGIVVENYSDYKYQVGVITPDDTECSQIEDYLIAKTEISDYDLDLSSIKWTSVKAGKTMKISNKKVPKGSYLIYRIAGEDGNLPSTYEVHGPMEYDHLTYAGIASTSKMVGETLQAVASTNLYDDNNKLMTDALTIQWQSCEDIKAEEPKWDDISGATGETYTLSEGDKNKYIRVKIQDKKGNEPMYSDKIGPVKYVAPSNSDAEN